MKLPQIRMQSTFIQLGLKTIDAKHQIEQPQADLSIRQPLGELTIKTKPGKLYIDAKQCREDIGLTTNKKMMEQNAQKGNAAVMEGIARRISTGSLLLATIEDLIQCNTLNRQLVRDSLNYVNFTLDLLRPPKLAPNNYGSTGKQGAPSMMEKKSMFDSQA